MSIILTKGGRVSLTKEDGTSFNVVKFGANWGAIKRGGQKTTKTTQKKTGFFGKLLGKVSEVVEDITSEVHYESVDLDLSAIVLDERGRKIDTIYFSHKTGFGGAIQHSGDDLTGDRGEDDGQDNETITVKLNDLPSKAHYVFFVLNSFRHHKFDEIPHMGCRIYSDNTTLASFNIDNDEGFQSKEAMVIGRFYRHNNVWKFKADGVINNDSSIARLEATVSRLI